MDKFSSIQANGEMRCEDMKRRLLSLLLAFAAAAALTAPAFADVLWEPYGNDFYEAHRDECVYENRKYLANGEAGYVTIQASPQSSAEVFNVPNGEAIQVGFRWTDGTGAQWAVATYGVRSDSGDWAWYDGWIPMSRLELVYDSIAFEEDHAGELGEYDGSGDDLTEIVVYQYPGGPLASQVSFQVDVEENPLSEYFQYLYTDENGLRWSKMGYYYGCRNVWVCLDRPVDDTLGEEQPQAAAQVRGEDSPALHPAAEEVPAPRTIPLWLIPAALVILAAAVTALLVRRTRKGKGGAE